MTIAAFATKKTGQSSSSKSQPLKLDENLSYRLSILNFLMNKATSKIYIEQGLNSHQWRVLSVLYHFGSLPASGILQWVVLDKAAVSRALQELRKLKLVDRSLHSTDARTVIVNLTPKAEKLYIEMSNQMAELQKGIFSDLPHEEVKLLFEMFNHIEKKLRAVSPSGDNGKVSAGKKSGGTKKKP